MSSQRKYNSWSKPLGDYGTNNGSNYGRTYGSNIGNNYGRTLGSNKESLTVLDTNCWSKLGSNSGSSSSSSDKVNFKVGLTSEADVDYSGDVSYKLDTATTFNLPNNDHSLTVGLSAEGDGSGDGPDFSGSIGYSLNF